jgi:hypothetical protein
VIAMDITRPQKVNAMDIASNTPTGWRPCTWDGRRARSQRKANEMGLSTKPVNQ